MKDEFEVIALRLLKEMSELRAALADQADHPDPEFVKEQQVLTISRFLRREFGTPLEARD